MGRRAYTSTDILFLLSTPVPLACIDALHTIVVKRCFRIISSGMSESVNHSPFQVAVTDRMMAHEESARARFKHIS